MEVITTTGIVDAQIDLSIISAHPKKVELTEAVRAHLHGINQDLFGSNLCRISQLFTEKSRVSGEHLFVYHLQEISKADIGLPITKWKLVHLVHQKTTTTVIV